MARGFRNQQARKGRSMSPEQYKKTRQRLGTISEVAALLGVARETVSRRENGKQEITKEAALAIKALRNGTAA